MIMPDGLFVPEPWSYIYTSMCSIGCMWTLHKIVWPIVKYAVLTIDKWSKQ